MGINRHLCLVRDAGSGSFHILKFMFDTKFLTTEEAAGLLGLSRKTLERWRLTGEGPKFVRLSSRCVRYREADLDEWASTRTYSSTSAATVAAMMGAMNAGASHAGSRLSA